VSAPARTDAPRLAGPASSTAPRAVTPATPPAVRIAITPETLEEIRAVLADGEALAEFVAKALRYEIGCRQGARAFRKALGLDAPPAPAPGPVKAGCANGCTEACAHVARGVIGSGET
jgi:hypothetical protein